MDLHLHSTASDGTLTPADLVACAQRHGVSLMALTDHDTTAGIGEASRAAAQRGITFVPGIEISTTWEGVNVHVVGLAIDPANATLRSGLQRLARLRAERAEEIASRLAKRRIGGALAGARGFAGSAGVTRTHFARWLAAAGYAADPASAHKRYLARGRPGHVPSNWIDVETAIQWITAAEGVAVLAHPLRYPLHKRRLRCLVEEFVAAGGTGMEVVSGSQSPDRTPLLVELAKRHELYASGGSDFHSPEQTWLTPGRYAPMPAGCRPIGEALPGVA